jgi:IS5 family transposase
MPSGEAKPKQQTFATVNGFEKPHRVTHKAVFLERMERSVPWGELCGLIEPYYPKPVNDRPPVELVRMLRLYLLANGFDLGDEACGGALYDIPLFR